MSSATAAPARRGNRRLELVGPERTPGKSSADQFYPIVDCVAVPQVAILLGEGGDAAVWRRACHAPRLREQHEREQTGHLAIGREHAVDHARDADRLLGQVGPLEVRAPTWLCTPR